MWPSNGTYGVRLEYGHPGSALYAPALTPDKWLHPKLHTDGVRYRQLQYSRTFAPAAPTGPVGVLSLPVDLARRQLTNITPDVYIPSDVLRGISRDVKKTAPPPAVEPLQTSLLAFGFSMDAVSWKKRKCAAYAGGPSGTTLRLAEVVTQARKPENYENVVLDVPALGDVRCGVDLRERILGVDFAGTDYADSAGALVCARTAHAAQFYCPVSTTSEIDGSTLMAVEPVYRIDAELADVCFNPWYWHQFGTVDGHGNWEVVDLNHGVPSVFTSGSGQTALPALQPYNIQWGANLNQIMLSSAEMIRSVDLRAKAASHEYVPRDVSRIRHMAAVPDKSNEIFVATSEELVWMDLRMFPKELLAWKHHMDYESLKCSPFCENEDSYALLYSPSDPVVSCYQFGLRDGIPFSLDDPYIFQCQQGARILDIVPTPVRPADEAVDEIGSCAFLSTFQLLSDYSLSQQLFCTASAPLLVLDSGDTRGTDTSDVLEHEHEQISRDEHGSQDDDYDDVTTSRTVNFAALYTSLFTTEPSFSDSSSQPEPHAIPEAMRDVGVEDPSDPSAMAALTALSKLVDYRRPKIQKSGNISRLVSEWS